MWPEQGQADTLFISFFSKETENYRINFWPYYSLKLDYNAVLWYKKKWYEMYEGLFRHTMLGIDTGGHLFQLLPSFLVKLTDVTKRIKQKYVNKNWQLLENCNQNFNTVLQWPMSHVSSFHKCLFFNSYSWTIKIIPSRLSNHKQ